MKKSIKLMRFIDWGFMRYDTLLIVGKSKAEAFRWLRKRNKNWTTLVESTDMEKGQAVANHYGGYTVIYIKDFLNSWTDWDMLLHETSHIIDYIVSPVYPDNTELKAYAHENLFRLCRREIFKALDKNKK
jgi:hypothetical protein